MSLRAYPTYNLPLPATCPTCRGEGAVSYSGSEIIACPDCGPHVLCTCGSELPVADDGVCLCCFFALRATGSELNTSESGG